MSCTNRNHPAIRFDGCTTLGIDEFSLFLVGAKVQIKSG